VTSKEVLWVLCSALLHALWNTAAKRSAKPTSFLFLLTALTGMATLPLLFFIPYAELPASLGWLVLASAVSHGLSFIALSLAYEHGELSVVYPISRSTPLVVPLFAVPMLGEHVSHAGALGIALAVIGLWLVQTDGRVQLAAFKSRAALWAYVLLLLTAVFSIVDKRAMNELRHVPWHSPFPATTVFYCLFTAGSALIGLPFAWARLGPRALATDLKNHGLGIAGAALITWWSYALILEVMRTAPVSYVVAVRQISVLFAVAFAMFTLGERPGRARLSGAFASVLGVALIAFG
jgi:uncharacterized membrane protein